MNKLNTQIYEEASEWIVLHRSDDLDADAKRRFDAWVRESPQHLRAYLEMSTIWEDVPTLRPEWNASASELIARARAESNVVPLDFERVPGTGESGSIGTVPSVAAGTSGTSVEWSRDLELHATPVELLCTEPEPLLRSVPVVTMPASNSSRIKLLGVAATVLMLVSVASWHYLFRNVYTTDIGEQRTLALEDGSTVELNAQTKIRIAYTENQRTIQLLRGQALFKVAKDKTRPFVVDSDGTRVRAVGTQFDVYRKNAGTQVTVVEGRVAVLALGHAQSLSGNDHDTPKAVASDGPATSESDSNAESMVDSQSTGHGRAGAPLGGAAESANAHGTGKSRMPTTQGLGVNAHQTLQARSGEVLLSAGEQLTVSAAMSAEAGTHVMEAVPTRKLANVEVATAWTQQRLIFDFAPLTEVAAEFNRYNRRPLVIEDESLDDFNVSGSFSSTDPTLLLRFLRDQPGIVVTESATEIRIARQGAVRE